MIAPGYVRENAGHRRNTTIQILLSINISESFICSLSRYFMFEIRNKYREQPVNKFVSFKAIIFTC